MIHIRRASVHWAFTIGLLLPALYVAFVPGAYVSIWLRLTSSVLAGGATMVIFYAGIIKGLLYFLKLARGDGNTSERITEAILAIHVGVPTVILLIVIWATISNATIALVLRAFFAFLVTDFIVFPLLALLYLQDSIRHGKGDLATMFLVSIAVYVCVSFLTASNLIAVDSLDASIGTLSALEAAGARLYLLLLSTVAFIASPLFWLSTSLYSVDLAPPPLWISTIYVLILPVFLYYRNRRLDRVTGSAGFAASLPIEVLGIVSPIALAVFLTFLVSSVATFLAPHNMTGKVLQLLPILVMILIMYTVTTREDHDK